MFILVFRSFDCQSPQISNFLCDRTFPATNLINWDVKTLATYLITCDRGLSWVRSSLWKLRLQLPYLRLRWVYRLNTFLHSWCWVRSGGLWLNLVEYLVYLCLCGHHGWRALWFLALHWLTLLAWVWLRFRLLAQNQLLGFWVVLTVAIMLRNYATSNLCEVLYCA